MALSLGMDMQHRRQWDLHQQDTLMHPGPPQPVGNSQPGPPAGQMAAMNISGAQTHPPRPVRHEQASLYI